MANVLLTWELGGGLGHLIPMSSIVDGLLRRGHRVTIAARDLANVDRVFGSDRVRFFQAPHKSNSGRPIVEMPATFAQILRNVGFDDESELRSLSIAWQSIYDAVDPDVVLFDHSPSALVAARGRRFRGATIGIGFVHPADEYPLANLRPWDRRAADRAVTDEDHITGVVNAVLRSAGQEPVARLSRLYAEVDAVFLQSYPELDHFGVRQGIRYLGVPTAGRGEDPEWPYGDGPKLFAYLKHGQQFERLVHSLTELRFPLIVCCTSLGDGYKERLEHQFASVRFESRPLNLMKVVRECDVAVHHANHGTLCALMLAGKPSVMLPVQLEQGLLARRAEKCGGGVIVAPQEIDRIGAAVRHVATDPQLLQSRQGFASRYAGHDPNAEIEKLVDWI